jgi:flagellar motor switch protein FliM
MVESNSSQVRQAAQLLVKSAVPAADPLESLKGAFERLAARCTETLGELAPVPMDLAFRDMASCPIGDAHAGFGETAMIGAFQTPDKGIRILVGADTALLDASLDAVFGADGSEPANGERAATRIGLRLAGTIFQRVIDELRPSLFGSKAAALELEKVYTADELPAPARRDESSVVARFGLSMLDRAGEMFVILPQSALQGVQPGAATAAGGGASAPGDTGWSKRIEQEVQRTEVTLHAVLDERQLTLGEIAGLHVGQVLALKATPRSNVKVVCNDQTMFWCELGQAQGMYTLRIKDFPDQERELIDAITSQ